MYKSFFLLFFLLIHVKSFSQFEYFAINPNNYQFIELEGMAEHLGLKNQKLVFGYNNDEDTLFIVSIQEKNTMVMGHVLNNYFFNSAKMNDIFWRNDSVFISSEMPFRATIWTFEFIWDKNGERFFATEPDYYDPSAEALEKADSLLAIGDVRGAINHYYGVMYPSAYMNEAATGVQLMEKCHEIAMKYYKENNLDSTIAMMEVGLGYYPNSNYLGAKSKEEFESNKAEYAYNMIWTPEQEKLWLGDYGLFLCRDKQFEKSIEVNKYLTMIFPDLTGPYLQLGDTYFEAEEKTLAKETYQKYISLKKAQKKEKDIPNRVKERVK